MQENSLPVQATKLLHYFIATRHMSIHDLHGMPSIVGDGS